MPHKCNSQRNLVHISLHPIRLFLRNSNLRHRCPHPLRLPPPLLPPRQRQHVIAASFSNCSLFN